MPKVSSPFFHNSAIATAFQGLAGGLQVDGTDVARRRLYNAKAAGAEGETAALDSLAGIFMGGDMSNTAGIGDMSRRAAGAAARGGMTGDSFGDFIRGIVANSGGSDASTTRALAGSGVKLGINDSVSLDGQKNLISRKEAGLDGRNNADNAAIIQRNSADNIASGQRNSADNIASGQRNDADNVSGMAKVIAQIAGRQQIADANRNRPEVSAGASVYDITPATTDADGAPIAAEISKLLTAPPTPSQTSGASAKNPITVWDYGVGRMVKADPSAAGDTSRYAAKAPFQLDFNDATTRAGVAQSIGENEDELQDGVYHAVTELAQTFMNHSGVSEQEAIRKAASLLQQNGYLVDPTGFSNVGIKPGFSLSEAVGEIKAALTSGYK